MERVCAPFFVSPYASASHFVGVLLDFCWTFVGVMLEYCWSIVGLILDFSTGHVLLK